MGIEQQLRVAAEAGQAEAMVELGVLLAQRGQTAEAEQWYRRAAAAGHPNAPAILNTVLRRRSRRKRAGSAIIVGIVFMVIGLALAAIPADPGLGPKCGYSVMHPGDRCVIGSTGYTYPEMMEREKSVQGNYKYIGGAAAGFGLLSAAYGCLMIMREGPRPRPRRETT